METRPATAQPDTGPCAVLMPVGDASTVLPVVVLMGWVNAQRDGTLLKYAELLAAHGFPSVRSVCPTDVAFSPLPGGRRRWAVSMLEFLEAQGLWPQRPLVLYAFSNGGAFVVEQLQLLAETNPRFSRLPSAVAGFVFDSAPAYMHRGALQRVLAATEPPGPRRWLRAAYYAAAARLRALLPGGVDRQQTFWSNMLRLGWGRPLLYLYSGDDQLCDGSKVDELVQQKRAAGQDVWARRWEQSEHVAHLRHHPQQYTALLLHFLHNLAQLAGQAALPVPQRAKL